MSASSTTSSIGPVAYDSVQGVMVPRAEAAAFDSPAHDKKFQLWGCGASDQEGVTAYSSWTLKAVSRERDGKWDESATYEEHDEAKEVTFRKMTERDGTIVWDIKFGYKWGADGDRDAKYSMYVSTEGSPCEGTWFVKVAYGEGSHLNDWGVDVNHWKHYQDLSNGEIVLYTGSHPKIFVLYISKWREHGWCMKAEELHVPHGSRSTVFSQLGKEYKFRLRDVGPAIMHSSCR